MMEATRVPPDLAVEVLSHVDEMPAFAPEEDNVRLDHVILGQHDVERGSTGDAAVPRLVLTKKIFARIR